MNTPPTLVWLRRDLRLADNNALASAAARGPVIPVFIMDDVFERTLGAASRLRLEAALAALGPALAAAGAPLILRKGPALPALRALIAETRARAVYWTRLTDGPSLDRDREVKAALKANGLEVESFGGHTLLDPWVVRNKTDGQFKVYTPFRRATSAREIPPPAAAPQTLTPAPAQPECLDLAALGLAKAMGPAAEALASRIEAGEAAALARMEAFLDGPVMRYGDRRDALDAAGTSGLSDSLAWGEISPRTIWEALRGMAGDGPETLRAQVIWRDFAHMLLFHDPEMEARNWRREWDRFPWREDDDLAARWRAGRTGVDVIDAAMRELWVTGRMHNRARMLVGSYLTKNLMLHWRIGAEWFRDTLIDWDPANNAMGWQWVAGSGPDASPFFRIFNPETQAEKFDPSGRYRNLWLNGAGARDFAAMWRKSDVTNVMARSGPLVDLKTSRKEALAAYDVMRSRQDAA